VAECNNQSHTTLYRVPRRVTAKPVVAGSETVLFTSLVTGAERPASVVFIEPPRSRLLTSHPAASMC